MEQHLWTAKLELNEIQRAFVRALQNLGFNVLRSNIIYRTAVKARVPCDGTLPLERRRE